MKYWYFAAEITFIIQGIMFPVLIIASMVIIYKQLLTPGTKKKVVPDPKAAGRKSPERVGDEKLEPLSCSSCGGPLLVDTEKSTCLHCGSQNAVSPHYLEIFKFRQDAANRLNNAMRYWRKANRLTSPLFRNLLLLLIFWFFAVLFLIVRGAADQELVFSDQLGEKLGAFGEFFYGMSFVALFMWMLILFITRGIIGPKVRKNLPVLESDSALISKDEHAECGTCGGPLHFHAREIGTVCNYCGVETYRVRFSWKLHNQVNEIRKRASFSLLEAMDAYRAAYDDAMGTPVMLVFILIILPFFLFALPVLLWDFITEHPLIATGIGLLIGGMIYLFVRMRRKVKKGNESESGNGNGS